MNNQRYVSHPGPGRIISWVRSTTVGRYSPLWAYHSLTVLFLGTHEQFPSGSPIMGVLWPPSHLTSKFLRNPKPELPKGLVLGRDENIHLRITPLGDGPDVLVSTPRPGLGSDTKLSHPGPGRIISRAPSELPKGFVLGRDENIHLRITPLGDGPDVLVGTPQRGLGSDTKLSHPRPGRIISRARSTTVTHPGSDLASFSLNFGVPTEPEASELPKGLVLGRDENIYLRITPLDDVGMSQYVTSMMKA
ncbi:hypothetical protein DVH24_003820 [Malus domestica]|uniref:Uncharacterized protein n=1 Tax=Malus domestica TaxID=3750 RepID=A0A498K6Z1_MALDO|nr:hypothetical protein DVH24_003820 [Malus domestica]